MRRVFWFTALCTIILAAFILRVFRLDVQSLWYDEAFSVYLAHFDLATITARTAADIQPPLYYYFLHFWLTVAGDGEFALRLLSLCFGVLTIPLLYVTARRLFTPTPSPLPRATGEGLEVGVIAALLATISPLYVWYSQEARMYNLITFWLLLSSYALLKGLEETQRKWWGVFAIANIAAVYTHYFAFVVIAFQLLFALVSSFNVQSLRLLKSKPEALKPLTLSFVAIIVAFLPWTPFVLARFGQDASYWRGALKLDEALRHILINFTMGESVLENIAQSIAAGWLVVLLIGLAASAIQNSKFKIQNVNHPITFAVLYLVVPLALVLFLFSRNPKFNARYLMIASPAFFLLLATGLASMHVMFQRAKTLARASVGIILITLYGLLFTSALYADYNAYFDPAFTKASFRDVVQYIEKHIASDEAIILTSGHMFPAFNYYYRGDAPTIRLPDEPTLNTERVLGYDTANVLNQTIAGKRGAWVVLWQDEVVDPNGFVPMLLSSCGKEAQLEPTSFYQVRLRYWTLQPNARFTVEPEPGTRHVANFKNQFKLLGWDSPNPTPADVGASFNLYWQSLDMFEDDYNVALRVVDAAGNLWGKQDRRPAGYNYPTTRWKKGENLFGAYTVPLLAGAPAGDYFVEITFYTKSNESGLDVLAPNGAPIGKSVKVGPIPVLPATKPAMFASLNIQNTISQSLPPFTLLGYQLERDKASAGETIPLTLFWRADAQPDKDYRFRLWFDGSPTAFLPLANARFPTSAWRAGEIVRGQYRVPIPSNITAGVKELKLNLNGGAGVGLGAVLASFTIEKTDRVFVKPNAQFDQMANFNNYLALVGYDLPTSNLKPNDTLKLVVYWQARTKIDKPYTVFVHLLDKDGKVIAQKDVQPLNGARPTTTWVANEFITDAYDLALKPDLAPGEYQIEIGWYDAKDPSFARLQVLDDSGAPIGDHIILKTIITVQ